MTKQDKVKVRNFEKLPNIQVLQEILHAANLMKLLDKMYKYAMDPTRTVGATERTQDARLMDGRTDGRSETNIPPTTSLFGGIIITWLVWLSLW